MPTPSSDFQPQSFRDQLIMSLAAVAAEKAMKAKMTPIIAALESDMDDLRLAVRYLVFDLEATKRERDEAQRGADEAERWKARAFEMKNRWLAEKRRNDRR